MLSNIHYIDDEVCDISKLALIGDNRFMPEKPTNNDMKSSEIDHKPLDIAISGGSYIGLTLAATLSVSGRGALTITVIDPQDMVQQTPESDGRAFAISYGSKQLLDIIGIWPKIRDHAQPVREIEITDTRLENAIRPALLHFDNKIGDEPSTYIIESHHLLNALKTRVLELENITLKSRTRISNRTSSGHFVELSLDDGSTLKSKLLIAADGKNSLSRKSAGIKTVGWSYNQMGIVATIAHTRPHNGKAVQHFFPSGPFAILPLPNDRSSLVWSDAAKNAERLLQADDEEFLQEIRARVGNSLGNLLLVGKRAGFPLNLQIAREFISDRLALVGDAAHGVHPIAGLGMNIGFRDIAALTETVIDSHRLGLDIGGQLTLENYSRWRRFDSAVSSFAMDALNRLFSNDLAPMRIIRDLGLGLVNRSPALKNLFVNEAAGLTGKIPLLLQGKEI